MHHMGLGMTSWVVALLPTFFLWRVVGHLEGYSALCGALIALIPAYLLAQFVLRPAPDAKAVALALYIGEAVKWLATFLLFLGAVIYLKLIWWLVFLSFGWAQLSVVFCQSEREI